MAEAKVLVMYTLMLLNYIVHDVYNECPLKSSTTTIPLTLFFINGEIGTQLPLGLKETGLKNAIGLVSLALKHVFCTQFYSILNKTTMF